MADQGQGELYPHIINAISESSNELEYQTKREQEEEIRSVKQICEGKVCRPA